jgi:peptidoglycan/xylan/chitin deacetylase (PgdA/CDA1 family)
MEKIHSPGWPTFLFENTIVNDKRICLTIDDGPNPHATIKILDVLDTYNVKATFFLIGCRVKKNPELAKEIHQRGHVIGNHSYHHYLIFWSCGIKRMEAEIRRCEEIVHTLGIPACKYFRPPGGGVNRNVLQAARNYMVLGVNHWISDNTLFSSKVIAAKMLSSVGNRGGGVIVLHEGVLSLLASTRHIVADALIMVIPELLEQGYMFCGPEELTGSKVIIQPH